jgi:RNA polymerase sigma-70 factor (ECF subfamily)
VTTPAYRRIFVRPYRLRRSFILRVDAELCEPVVIAPAPVHERWLDAFHAGDKAVLEQCYRDHYAKVARAVGRVLGECDAETVTHETYYRLLSDARLRENFAGGNFAAWLTRVAMNAALDLLRRRRHESAELPSEAELESRAAAERAAEELEAKLLIEQFQRERLPPEWAPVFEARFLRRLTQRDAASELGMKRSTLAYQEERIRELLAKFLVKEGR